MCKLNASKERKYFRRKAVKDVGRLLKNINVDLYNNNVTTKKNCGNPTANFNVTNNIEPSQTFCNSKESFGSVDINHYLNRSTDTDSESVDHSDNKNRPNYTNDNLKMSLTQWALKFSISLVALTALLKILYPYHANLPKDARTLLKTPRVFQVKRLAGGTYYYFGIFKYLKAFLEGMYDKLNDGMSISLQLNIDGLPLFRSSNCQFWPILGFLRDYMKEPFIIGLYSGNHKPDSLHDYLQDLIREIVDLSKGFIIINKKLYLEISAIICDAPARSFIKGIKSHNGHYGCDRCLQKGKWISHRMTFPEAKFILRTDQMFSNIPLDDDDHRRINSPFINTSIGMVSRFPHDYMHLVCLGVVKKLLKFWVSGPLKCRLPSISVKNISSKLISCRSQVPIEFNRKPRSIEEKDHWKATEFRQFLLYTGPVVLKGILDKGIYDNFMVLFNAIYILCSTSLCHKELQTARDLLDGFVKHFPSLYGNEHLVYNIHNLLHLADDVEVHGSLDTISAFPYENFLGKLKRLIRKPDKPLCQVICRIGEINFSSNNILMNDNYKIIYGNEYSNGPLPRILFNVGPIIHYKEIYGVKFCLSIKTGDNCISFDDKVGIIINIIQFKKSAFVVLREYLSKVRFYKHPINSSLLGIYKVSNLSKDITFIPLTFENIRKCFLIPYKDQNVAVPLID